MTKPILIAAMLAALGLAGCDAAPKHDPADPFYVGHVARSAATPPDPSVGTGRSPVGTTSPGGTGPYMSGGGGVN